MKFNYSIVLTPIPEGYRLSINGEDYEYRTMRDVQARVAALVWLDPDTSSLEIQVNYNTR